MNVGPTLGVALATALLSRWATAPGGTDVLASMGIALTALGAPALCGALAALWLPRRDRRPAVLSG
ncbi:hypothetical protein [Streptomyces beihaiensis]|uniref:MFS transporter n=1 Tax=Streptomyces beihaiensis TaxID=2984495 RepID=A0ABT3TW00_9ACTN|nr:hypothetical protein [Streptomyces beihaiensis]MCX3061234.1 hypothetical protein [Streptomyces beihaiensis]